MDCEYPEYRPNEDEPYLCERQIIWFRAYLYHWRHLLLRENLNWSSQLNQGNPLAADILDQSAENTTRNLAVLNGQRARQTILQINAALKRIEDGSFGYCLRSGEEIGLRRLLAWPIATLSVEAQELLERHSLNFRQKAM